MSLPTSEARPQAHVHSEACHWGPDLFPNHHCPSWDQHVQQRPGPQPCNQVTGTLAEQIERAHEPRPARLMALVERHLDELRPPLLELLAPDFADIARQVVILTLAKERRQQSAKTG